jgi:hypothetical protein
MSKKGWIVINAVKAAHKGHPDPRNARGPRTLSLNDIENLQEAQSLSDFAPKGTVPPLVTLGDFFSKAQKKG